jgi:hypothetical protein
MFECDGSIKPKCIATDVQSLISSAQATSGNTRRQHSNEAARESLDKESEGSPRMNAHFVHRQQAGMKARRRAGQ